MFEETFTVAALQINVACFDDDIVISVLHFMPEHKPSRTKKETSFVRKLLQFTLARLAMKTLDEGLVLLVFGLNFKFKMKDYTLLSVMQTSKSPWVHQIKANSIKGVSFCYVFHAKAKPLRFCL